MPRGRRLLSSVLALVLVVVAVELFVDVQVAGFIGPWPTVALLAVGFLAGAWLVRRAGARAVRDLRRALDDGRVPGDELADGALVLTSGLLLMVPGFVTDVVGAVLVLPLTRPLLRRLLAGVVARRLPRGPVSVGGFPTYPGRGPRPDAGAAGTRQRPGTDQQGPVVRGEVVDEGPDVR